jgi:hypothetical protein
MMMMVMMMTKNNYGISVVSKNNLAATTVLQD